MRNVACGMIPHFTHCTYSAIPHSRQSVIYHILAARLAVGCSKKPKTRQLNLIQLSKNARKRPDQTSGRKRPRMQDVVIVGADDLDESMAAAV